MNVYALQTARAGSVSVPNKNVMMHKNVPLYLHNIRYSLSCDSIQGVYCSTDCPEILKQAEEEGFTAYSRDPPLCTAEASHHDVIIDGLRYIEEDVEAELDVLVVLLGNSASAFTGDLTKAIQLLIDNPDADCVESVSQFNMFNPFRALRIDTHGRIQNFLDEDHIRSVVNINDRCSAGDIYFFNGSFWVIRRDAVIQKTGAPPFPWRGRTILPLVQDTCMEVDAAWQTKLLP